MNLKPAIFGAAFAASSLGVIDARAASHQAEILGDKSVAQQVEGNDGRAAAPAPELSNWAMMLAGFAGLGLAGYRRKVRALAA